VDVFFRQPRFGHAQERCAPTRRRASALKFSRRWRLPTSMAAIDPAVIESERGQLRQGVQRAKAAVPHPPATVRSGIAAAKRMAARMAKSSECERRRATRRGHLRAGEVRSEDDRTSHTYFQVAVGDPRDSLSGLVRACATASSWRTAISEAAAERSSRWIAQRFALDVPIN
jgi:hypothetical protein